MSTYTERVTEYLKGCEAVSTGLCPGCDECRSQFRDYSVTELDPPDDCTEAQAEAWGTRYGFKAREDQTYQTEAEAETASREAFREDWESGDLCSEPSFSRSACDICGSTLGGDREDWHYVDPQNRIQHCGSGACVDCVAYLANGTEPEPRETAEDSEADGEES